jgi:hypothetical protein
VTVHSLALTRAGLIAALRPAADAPDPSAEITEARRRLAVAIEIYGNDDALARRVALGALAASRAAYWTTARYHSQKACALQLAVHAQPSIEAALNYAYSPGKDADVRLAALETLVPVNLQAAEALVLAYTSLGATDDVRALQARSEHTMPQRARSQESSLK